MKKIILLFIFAVFIFTVAFIALIIYLSFAVVKPRVTKINLDLTRKFSEVIKFPQIISYPQLKYGSTTYIWEMQTAPNEKTGVEVLYNPDYNGDENSIKVTLQMVPGSDPSIFTKALSQLISDPQSLKSAQEPLKANLSPNPSIGYSKISIDAMSGSSQTTQMSWEFKRSEMPAEIKDDYKELNKLPNSLVKILFPVPQIIIDIFKG